MFHNDENINKFAIELNNLLNNSDAGKKKYLIIEVADEEYAVPIEFVKGISEMKKITKIAGMSKHIQGVVNIGNDIVQICDMRERIGTDRKEYNKFTMIVMVFHKTLLESKIIGIVPDGIVEVRAIADGEINVQGVIKESVGQEYIKGIVKTDKKFTLILNMENLIK